MELKRRVKADITIPSYKNPCPACGERGIVDFIDLVRGRSEIHCTSCPELWVSETEAPMAFLVES